MSDLQLNISELPGPTFMYSGLSKDNVASVQNKHLVANPLKFAQLSLQRMRLLLDEGVPQVIFPPHRRPDMQALEVCGFTGDMSHMISSADKFSNGYLESLLAASSVWTANAATVTPSADSEDGKVHITTANLNSHYHRSIEASQTHAKLARLFSDDKFFCLHQALPGHSRFSDEGAANHMRFHVEAENRGLNVFVYSNDPDNPEFVQGRQTLWASKAICQLHALPDSKVLLQKQSKEAISRGIFHNDIISMNSHDLLVFHQQAYEDHESLIEKLMAQGICCVEIKAEEFSLEHALKTYFFNSEFISGKDGGLVLVMSKSCQHDAKVQVQLDRIQTAYSKEIKTMYVDLDDSLRNGGGPACLRLRVQLNQEQFSAIPSQFLLTQNKLEALQEVVTRFYRESLSYEDVLTEIFQRNLQPVYTKLEQILGWNHN
ncbi:succinylarginine dihydrolase [Rheinheimera pacifica]|uniref:Succinylarginine dihydrolase n=1 Tax=Rheinheimera pacifica TaxID=173990 RepID=A0A1H6MR77_9GAMM|nr:N-succinylarginine dihydrolase [Rheinheimera pacifica]SEI00219.1 succinylarginine dihydrolase [Rheinheimera pacifica]